MLYVENKNNKQRRCIALEKSIILKIYNMNINFLIHLELNEQKCWSVYSLYDLCIHYSKKYVLFYSLWLILGMGKHFFNFTWFHHYSYD